MKLDELAYSILRIVAGAMFVRRLPIVNGGEDTVLCFVFLLIAARGAGAWSLDRAVRAQ